MKNLLLTFVLLFGFNVFGQNVTLDKAHAQLQFYAKHLTISNVEGKFTNFDVHLTGLDKGDLSKAKFHVVADINSINTGIDARDNHLKSADFFDAEKFGKLEFTSTSVKKEKGNNYKLAGNLTLHGVTKPVTLTLVSNGSVVNPMNKTNTHGFTVKGTINRADFGLGANFPEAVVGNEITIVSNLEFTENK